MIIKLPLRSVGLSLVGQWIWVFCFVDLAKYMYFVSDRG